MSFSGGGRNRYARSNLNDSPPAVPRERRTRTASKIVVFFVPSKGEVTVVLAAILAWTT